MKNFVAFDFETANADRTSVCSIGMVFVENNRVKETVYELINPEGYFDPRNTMIHGITEEDVVNAPTFDVFYEGIKNKLENKLLVAHFLPFDGYVLRDSLERYRVTPVPKQLMCSYQLAKKLLPDLSSHTLKSMCRHFRIGLDQHHHALADARACAELVVHLTELGNIEDEETLIDKTGIRVGELTPTSFRTSKVGKKSGKKVDLRNIQTNREAEKGHVFYGKRWYSQVN
ncbi:3'-5' exonuclease [Sutcliffiella rhizosphaerae]|uniref:3'-5' exonuclease DinG n=1 Tax=Sutcliffiella rhizosphaerae TaxID=2880967 RepID=A0ABM8YKG6_9BACI|nr:3'-5' exonuclease [Sutcliffiella rhizosphaerae]CAG9620352.1 3'-5' exonuclease DinG [Sutcliffiella rhizosphaerae]